MERERQTEVRGEMQMFQRIYDSKIMLSIVLVFSVSFITVFYSEEFSLTSICRAAT